LYRSAKTNWAAAPADQLKAWVFARATFDLAEFATSSDRRAELAREGIEAARAALVIDGDCAPAHYYLAMNLGQLARTQTLGALRLVREMEHHFEIVGRLDPKFDYSGADRNLGILYREAPGWPASIGNRAKAETHLVRAVKGSPEYPGNQLELLQARINWKEFETARELAPNIEQCLQAGRKLFVGESWEWSWDDWNRLWKQLQQQLQKAGR
jgi:hypothetical protein